MAAERWVALAELEGWAAPPEKTFLTRVAGGVVSFARRKPLGFACALIIVFFLIIGDAVPETLNKVASTRLALGDFGVGLPRLGTVKPDLGTPVPYFADQLEKNVGFIYPYEEQNLARTVEGSSSDHLLGTDQNGRDVLSRLFYGARVAVMVALGGTVIAVAIGATIGIVSGFYMGWLDKGLYRLVDMFQALPGIILLIVILGVFGSGLWQMIFVLGLVYGPSQSRVIRGQVLAIMETPYVEAARVVGANDRRVMTRYLLPNVFHLVVLNATFLLGLLVLVEATLSFLGYGLQPPFPSWGQMLSLEGRQYMRTQPTLAIYPGLAIAVLVFAFNLFGDALRDVLDPRLRGSR